MRFELSVACSLLILFLDDSTWLGALRIEIYLSVSALVPACPAKCLYRAILSVLDTRKCEYLKDYSLDFEHAYMTTYLAS